MCNYLLYLFKTWAIAFAKRSANEFSKTILKMNFKCHSRSNIPMPFKTNFEKNDKQRQKIYIKTLFRTTFS